MSLLKRIIGQKKKKPTKKDQTKQVNDAIHKLRDHVTILNKRKTHSEKQISKYNKEATQCLKNKNRKGALSKIKLRKQVEKRLETLENQIFNLEVQIMALDETLMNRNMMNAMTVARNAMHVENADAMLDQVEQTQEDIQEALDLQKEFNDLMGTPLVDYDDDELERELAGLDDEIMDDGLLYGHINQKNKNKNKNKKNIEQKEDVSDDEDQYEDESEDDEVKQIKKLEMEMNLTANDKHIIDVQIVQTASC